MSPHSFSWTHLRRSFSSLSLNSKVSPDLTNMEVQQKSIRTIVHQSSSSLLNVNLSSSAAFVPNARAPPVPVSQLAPQGGMLAAANLRRPPLSKRKRKAPWKSRANQRPPVQLHADSNEVTIELVEEPAKDHLAQNWLEFEDTRGALIYIMAQPES